TAPARRSDSGDLCCAPIMRRPAAPASISWKSATTSMPRGSASSPSASAATTRRAVRRLSRASLPASPGVRSGTITRYGSGVSRRNSRLRSRCPAITSCGLEDALKRLEPFKLDGVVQKKRCPFLVVHGGDDEQIPLADAQALYDACGSKDKTLRVFTGEEGGAQHCQRDYLTLGCATMWSWFEDKLIRA